MSVTVNTFSTSNFSTTLLSKLAVKPSVFLRMLTSNKSTSVIATTSGVSTRTVQRYRRSLGVAVSR